MSDIGMKHLESPVYPPKCEMDELFEEAMQGETTGVRSIPARAFVELLYLFDRACKDFVTLDELDHHRRYLAELRTWRATAPAGRISVPASLLRYVVGLTRDLAAVNGRT